MPMWLRRRLSMKHLARIGLIACSALWMLAPAQAQNRTFTQEQIHSVYHNEVSVRALVQAVGEESKDFRTTFEKRYRTMFVPEWRRTDTSRKAVQQLDE